MARTVDYSKKAEKIKEQVDELVQELMAAKSARSRYLGEEQIRKNSAKVLIKVPFPSLRMFRKRHFIF